MIAAVDKTVAEFGGIDICVNNASAISLTNSQATDMKAPRFAQRCMIPQARQPV